MIPDKKMEIDMILLFIHVRIEKKYLRAFLI